MCSKFIAIIWIDFNASFEVRIKQKGFCSMNKTSWSSQFRNWFKGSSYVVPGSRDISWILQFYTKNRLYRNGWALILELLFCPVTLIVSPSFTSSRKGLKASSLQLEEPWANSRRCRFLWVLLQGLAMIPRLIKGQFPFPTSIISTDLCFHGLSRPALCQDRLITGARESN